MVPLLAALATLALTLVLARSWRGRGWGDAPEGPEAGRKRQAGRVPAVGGLAIAAVWAASVAWGGVLDSGPGPAGLLELFPGADPGAVRGAAGAALLAALAVGVLDDHRPGGLKPLPKLLLQALGGALLALPLWFPEGFGAAPAASLRALLGTALWSLAGVVAMNAWNTFDNADGAAGALAALGLWPVSPLLAAAPLGFLVPNLLLRRRPEPGSKGKRGDPLAYLGDGGSHLLGMALLLSPGAWPGFLLPLLDLARVGFLRSRRGLAPWQGDRRHLAHRLQGAGLPPAVVVLALCLIAAPALWRPDPWGLGVTSLLFCLAVALTPSSR